MKNITVEQIYNAQDEALIASVEGKGSQKDPILDTRSRLEKLGFKQASKKIDAAQKLALAYELYLYVPEKQVTAFNEKLRAETLKEDKNTQRFKTLVFIPVEEYNEVPPDHVLTAIERAKDVGCFDAFEVAKIEWKKEIKDPIVFGRVNGSTDRFFIAQWDDDVSIEDILNAAEK